jgi:ketosteroid isomerase-like protein
MSSDKSSPHDPNRQVVDNVWNAIKAKDLDALDRLFHDDYVQEWPQSGERIRGKRNARELKEHYPGQRTPTLRRISGGGDVRILEAFVDYGDEVAHAISVMELKDGRVIRETDYFGAPFEAPEWRAQWVERFDAEATAARSGKRIS